MPGEISVTGMTCGVSYSPCRVASHLSGSEKRIVFVAENRKVSPKLFACDQGDVVHFQCVAVSNTQQIGGIVHWLPVVRNNLGPGPNICFPRFASIGDSRVVSFATSPFVPLLCDR